MSPKERLPAPHERIAETLAKIEELFVHPSDQLFAWVVREVEACQPGLGPALQDAIADPGVSIPSPCRWRIDEVEDLLNFKLTGGGTPSSLKRFCRAVREELLNLLVIFTPARPLASGDYDRDLEIRRRMAQELGSKSPRGKSRANPSLLRTRAFRLDDPASCLAALREVGGHINAASGEERLKLGFERALEPYLHVRGRFRYSPYEIWEKERQARESQRRLHMKSTEGLCLRDRRTPLTRTPKQPPLPDVFLLAAPTPPSLRTWGAPADRAMAAVRRFCQGEFASLWNLACEALEGRKWNLCWSCGDLTTPSRRDRGFCSRLCRERWLASVRILSPRSRSPEAGRGKDAVRRPNGSAKDQARGRTPHGRP